MIIITLSIGKRHSRGVVVVTTKISWSRVFCTAARRRRLPRGRSERGGKQRNRARQNDTSESQIRSHRRRFDFCLRRSATRSNQTQQKRPLIINNNNNNVIRSIRTKRLRLGILHVSCSSQHVFPICGYTCLQRVREQVLIFIFLFSFFHTTVSVKRARRDECMHNYNNAIIDACSNVRINISRHTYL